MSPEKWEPWIQMAEYNLPVPELEVAIEKKIRQDELKEAGNHSNAVILGGHASVVAYQFQLQGQPIFNY